MKDIYTYWTKLSAMGISFNLLDMELEVNAPTLTLSEKLAKRVVDKLNKMNINLQEIDSLTPGDIKKIVKELNV